MGSSAVRSRSLRGLLVTVFSLVALAAAPTDVAAECDGPVPSFRDALATAKRVVIADVVAVRSGGLVQPAASDGWSSRFTIRVRHTPVGESPAIMEIRDLPTQPCADVLQARRGDRLALAFAATDYTPPILVNTVAWIRGTPWDSIGVETITTAQVFRLLHLTPPDTATLARPTREDDPVGTLIAVTAGAVSGLLVWRRYPSIGSRRVILG